MIVALALAGGQARRMGGGDKVLLPLGGATVLDAMLARLAPQVAQVAISANGDAARFGRFGLPVLADPPWAQGPLAGVAAGLTWAAGLGAASLLTVPGDTPFIPKDLVARLRPAPAWAESGGAVHRLVALWPVAAGPLLEAWLRGGGSLRVLDFGLSLGMRGVAFPETPDPFLNINTPADLAQAEALGKAAARPHLGA
jgi:molybdopterin-guanine dinucleotide biosynthesis protein A